MNRRAILKLAFVFAVATAVFLLPSLGPQVHAQPGCAEFRALSHLILPSPYPPDTWGGNVRGTLGGEFLAGYITGNDGEAAGHGVSNTEKYGLYVLAFGADTFTMRVTHAEFNFPPGKVGFGAYRGHATIVSGTGKFASASGSIVWDAPFIVWTTDGQNFYGLGNATIAGTICGISAQ